MYYIADSRFESKGQLYRDRDEASEILDSDLEYLEAGGAKITRQLLEGDPDNYIYHVGLGPDNFELHIRLIK